MQDSGGYPVFYLRYNKNNKLIDLNFINKILEKYKIDVKVNPKLRAKYQEAFTHETYCFDKDKYFMENLSDKMNTSIEKLIENGLMIELQKVDYNKVEFVGDRFLEFVIVEYLYERFIDQDEGYMTQTKIKMVQKERLANYSRILKFPQYILMSAQHESKTERDDDSDLEDVFEAFIFILYNDIGPKNTRQFIRNFIEEETDWVVLDKMYRNYKQKLSQHLTKQGLSQPLYEQLPMNNVCKKYRVKVKDSYDLSLIHI